MALSLYNKKRNFSQTSEPKGKISKTNQLRFVVQRHHASRIHYDFRLQMNGVLKSWAVPKGPSLNPSVKRLAMLVEDHPVSYIDFEGTIPKGNYGAGTVEVWDNGVYQPEDEKGKVISETTALAAFEKGSLKVSLKGKKLKGEFALVRLKNDDGKSWLLIKHRDANAVDDEYNSEDYSRDKKKENKIATGQTTKTLKKKPEKSVVKSHSPTRIVTNYIKPMFASVADEAFDDKDWLFELKLDGYRAIAEINGNSTRLYSRNGLSFSEKYPLIATALKKIKHHVVLDGEIALLDENGKTDFQKLQHYENYTQYPLVYYVFDILILEDTDTTDLPLTERKKLVKKLLGKNTVIRYCDHIETKGKAFFIEAMGANLEGIMAKKKDSLYHKGLRSKEWLKIKNIQTHEAVIAGYTSGKGSRQHFGALILGKYSGKQLHYIGHTGTGFYAETLGEVWNSMQPLVTPSSPFKEKIKVNAPVTWVKPKLVAELNFTELTNDNRMRHPVFVRLRTDKNANEIIMNREEEKSPVKKSAKRVVAKAVKEQAGSKTLTVGRRKLELTNLDKIFWPKDGITKGDLVNYYGGMADYILPYLKNRPMSLKRNPNGIKDEGFYHKDAGEAAPAWVKKANIYSESSDKTIHYIVCNNKATLLYLANLGCIEMNPWNSTTLTLKKPSYLVIDIDPSDKNTFEQVIETALAVKAVLDKAGAISFCKTSGATGLHVYVPLKNKYEYNDAKEFAHVVAALAQEQLPSFTSLERNLTKRGNKIYIDYLQNRSGQTLASAYSVRPKDGATVSTPLEWKEVKKGLHPSQFHIHNIVKRIKQKGDLFAPVLQQGINIIECIKKLGG